MPTNITNSFRGILAILLFFLSLPMMGANEVTRTYQVDDLYYTLYDDGTAKVESYVKKSTEIEIPATVVYKDKEYSVTSIGFSAFNGCTSLTSIQIPNSVTRIGNYAFYGCTSLTSIDVAEDNQYYTQQEGVLFNKELTKLIQYPCGKENKEYEIPNSVTSIGDYAFSWCTSLTSIQIPNTVTSFGDSAFLGCKSLTSIEIPNTVTSFGDYAFSWCTSLTSIQIPNSVTRIGNGAFHECTSLTSIQIPNSVTSIGDVAFGYCTSLTSLQIPNSVTSIGAYAFFDCSSLTSIEIPNSVTSIGNYAFSGCTSLTSIDVAEDNQYYTQQEGVLFNKELTKLIQYPCGKENKEYEIPNSVTSIENGAFYKCTSLTSIQIPNSVTSIGNDAFYNCTSLTSIQIPNSVTSIGGCAFSSCTSLTSIQIPNSVTSIGYFAFDDCTSLTSIICEAIVPPTAIYESTFSTDTYTNCQLLVPDESIDSYKNSQYVWSKFANISANSEYVDIDSPEASYSTTSHPTIYNLNGTAVSGDIQSLSPGIYIIKEGSKSRKILVK